MTPTLAADRILGAFGGSEPQRSGPEPGSRAGPGPEPGRARTRARAPGGSGSDQDRVARGQCRPQHPGLLGRVVGGEQSGQDRDPGLSRAQGARRHGSGGDEVDRAAVRVDLRDRVAATRVVSATRTPRATAAATASTISGVALPAPVPIRTIPRAPASTAAFSSVASPSAWCMTMSTRGGSSGIAGSASGAGRCGVRSTVTFPKPTLPSSSFEGSANASRATACVFTVPRAACTRPAKATSTPSPRVVAAVSSAS